mmetsp:Transcript_126245/g.315626  ORF Transcript_126245/g.315626 Transcript_126245/m.315626 type:complete len:148 (-) Transcript_126245:3979-4422(-)
MFLKALLVQVEIQVVVAQVRQVAQGQVETLHEEVSQVHALGVLHEVVAMLHGVLPGVLHGAQQMVASASETLAPEETEPSAACLWENPYSSPSKLPSLPQGSRQAPMVVVVRRLVLETGAGMRRRRQRLQQLVDSPAPLGLLVSLHQ